MTDSLTLFHGTTAAAAEAIRREGFRAAPVREIVDGLARRYGKSGDAVWSDLQQNQSIVAFRPPAPLLWLTDNLSLASSYASRGSEAEWEALSAVFRLNHPTLPFGSDECHWWVFKQRLTDRPVVLTLKVPQQLDAPGGDHRLHRLPLPVEGIVVVAEELRPWTVERRLLRHSTGLNDRELGAQIQRNTWGETFDHNGRVAWSWDNVFATLSAERLRLLGLA